MGGLCFLVEFAKSRVELPSGETEAPGAAGLDATAVLEDPSHQIGLGALVDGYAACRTQS